MTCTVPWIFGPQDGWIWIQGVQGLTLKLDKKVAERKSLIGCSITSKVFFSYFIGGIQISILSMKPSLIFTEAHQQFGKILLSSPMSSPSWICTSPKDVTSGQIDALQVPSNPYRTDSSCRLRVCPIYICRLQHVQGFSLRLLHDLYCQWQPCKYVDEMLWLQ